MLYWRIRDQCHLMELLLCVLVNSEGLIMSSVRDVCIVKRNIECSIVSNGECNQWPMSPWGTL